jgi:hypothetical protein
MNNQKKKSNCFFFAFWLFWTRGGYLAFRRSRNITGIHWLWSPDLKNWLQYSPIEPKKNFFAAMIHKIWYHGHILRSDVPKDHHTIIVKKKK